MAKKKPVIDIFDGDICTDPDMDLVDALLEEDSVPASSILQVDQKFMSDIVQEAEANLKSQINRDLVAPTPSMTPSQVIKNTTISQGVMKFNAVPGSSLTNAIANPTENDNLLAVIKANKPTNTVLNAVMMEIAEEAAYIKAWRNENWSTGEDISEPTFKRIKMLKHLVETIVEQEKLKKDTVSGKVDFHGEPFQRVLKYFLETIQKTFRKVHIPEQFEDIFFTELAKSFDNFEKSAERIYYGKD